VFLKGKESLIGNNLEPQERHGAILVKTPSQKGGRGVRVNRFFDSRGVESNRGGGHGG